MPDSPTCPTCGSDDPGYDIRHGEKVRRITPQFKANDRRCPDSFHDQLPPDSEPKEPRMNEIRPYDDKDARRELAVEMFKQHVRKAGVTCNYDADIECMAEAIVAFADDWGESMPNPGHERAILAEMAGTDE